MQRPKSPKPAGGVLFVRVGPELLAELDRELRRRVEAEPGRRQTRSDVVREMLWSQVRGGGT